MQIQYNRVQVIKDKFIWIILPTDKNMQKFDFLTGVLVFYDCFMIPFKNTFGVRHLNPQIQNVMASIEYVILFVFALDVVLGFRKAYLDSMFQVVKDPVLIAKNYIKFFFWVDLLSAIPFDYFIKDGFLIYIGMIKVFRLLRLKKVIDNLGFSAKSIAKIRIIQLVVMLLMVIHLATCYLYSIVTIDYFTLGPGPHLFDLNYWMPVVDLNDSETTYYSDSTNVQYVQSFYYAFLLLTGNDISPQTPNQFTFCVFVIFIG
jgi:hypothetical protein